MAVRPRGPATGRRRTPPRHSAESGGPGRTQRLPAQRCRRVSSRGRRRKELPMRIGIITNYHLEQVGGAEEVIDRLATLWLGDGHDDAVFAAPARSERPTRPWQPAYRHIPLGRVFSSRFGLSRYVRALRRAHSTLPFDVVLACDAYWAGHVARL